MMKTLHDGEVRKDYPMFERLIDISLKCRIPMTLLVIAVLGLGARAYVETPRDAFPDISPVMVSIFAEAPGLAAEEIEAMIADPVESTMNGLPDVALVKSTSSFGMAVIYVYFKDGVDIYFARQLVAERLRSAEALLPPEVPPPELGPISTGLGQVFIYYLRADPDVVDSEGKELNIYLRELNDYVVKRQLQTVPGVTSILSMGGYVLQYQVRLDPDKLQEHDLSFSDITEAIRANHRNVGGQYLDIGAEEYLVRGIGRVESLDDIRNIVLKEIDGVPLRLASVGTVQYGPDIRRGAVSYNGEEDVVAGIVLKLYGENTSRVIAALHNKLDSIRDGLPKGVSIIPYYDQADLVDNATYTVESSLYIGMVLVILVLAISLWNVRGALIVALAMPFCAALAMLGLSWFNLSANLLSLGGIAIALGMLVDGSIVVVENIIRHLSLPENEMLGKLQIIAKAAKEVARPIAFALIIVIAVFIPIFFFEGVEGKMFRPLAFTIMVALGGSILAATVVAPVMASWLLSKKQIIKEQSGRPLLTRIIEDAYLPTLKASMRIRYILFPAILLLMTASILLLQKTGREFIPTLEEGSIMLTVSMAPSIGLSQSERVVKTLEKKILVHPEVTGTVTRIGRPEAGSHPHPVNFAEIHIELRQPEEGSIGAEIRQRIVGELRHALQDYPGVALNFSQPIQNSFDELLSGTRTYFALKLFGEDLDVLRTKAEEIRLAVATIPGVVDLSVEQSFGQPQIQIIPDADRMGRLGVSGADVMQLVESAIGGENVGTVYRQIRRHDINVRLADQYRTFSEDIGRLKVRTGTGRYVEISRVADIRLTEGPVQISREKIQRRWVIQGNVSDRAPSDIVRDMRRAIAEKIDLPPGYFVEFGGQFENQERAMRTLSIIVPIVIGTIFLLLWISFGSLRSGLIVLINVPLALIGGVVGLYATGQLLSVPAAVGFIALLGIAMQDGVVMVADFRELRGRGMPLGEAVLRGSAVRFRAVILTTLTTLLGLIPLLLSKGIGAEIQRPLAAIVVFGLASSTTLTLFFLPSLYYEIERWFLTSPEDEKTIKSGSRRLRHHLE